MCTISSALSSTGSLTIPAERGGEIGEVSVDPCLEVELVLYIGVLAVVPVQVHVLVAEGEDVDLQVFGVNLLKHQRKRKNDILDLAVPLLIPYRLFSNFET